LIWYHTFENLLKRDLFPLNKKEKSFLIMQLPCAFFDNVEFWCKPVFLGSATCFSTIVLLIYINSGSMGGSISKKELIWFWRKWNSHLLNIHPKSRKPVNYLISWLGVEVELVRIPTFSKIQLILSWTMIFLPAKFYINWSTNWTEKSNWFPKNRFTTEIYIHKRAQGSCTSLIPLLLLLWVGLGRFSIDFHNK